MYWWDNIVLYWFITITSLSPTHGTEESCDRTHNKNLHSGNIGQTKMFNWLGELRVYLDSEDHVAVTTLMLIRDRFAVGGANDIEKIPQHVLRHDSLAVFLPEDGVTWNSEVRASFTHPEYAQNNYTLALLQLNFVATRRFPLVPVCVAKRVKNTHENLYVVGTTHENNVLEKVLYKMSHVSKTDCIKFYRQLTIVKDWGTSTPRSDYTCASAPELGACVWETGMVLLANVSGWFNLIGFGIRGPGCSSPTRFLDIKYYLPWLRDVISSEAVTTTTASPEDVEFVPAHRLFREEPVTENPMISSRRLSDTLRGDVQGLPHFAIRTDTNEGNFTAFEIYTFRHSPWEKYPNACRTTPKMVYHEVSGVFTPYQRGTISYSFSIYDAGYRFITCVLLGVQTQFRSDARITFTEHFNFIDNIRLGADDESFIPKELFKYQVGPKKFVQESNISNFNSTPNYELSIKLEYFQTAKLEFEMYGQNISKELYEEIMTGRWYG